MKIKIIAAKKLLKKYKSITLEELKEKLVDWLNKNHFDYRGLIPMGLANDAPNLNIY